MFKGAGVSGLKPTSREGGRTLWQIYWNEDEEEPVVSMVDISNIELKEGDSFNSAAKLDEERGEIVVFEQNAKELEAKTRRSSSIYKKEFTEEEWEKFDMSPETRLTGKKFLFQSRSDSDLELFLPGQRRNERCARLRWCCLSCRTREFWRQYWRVLALVLLAILAYALITFVIIKSMLSW